MRIPNTVNVLEGVFVPGTKDLTYGKQCSGG